MPFNTEKFYFRLILKFFITFNFKRCSCIIVNLVQLVCFFDKPLVDTIKKNIDNDV